MLHRRRERGGRGRRRREETMIPIHLLPVALFTFYINDHHHVWSFKVLRPVPHSRNDIHRASKLPSIRPCEPLPAPKGSCNSLWSKYQDLQCVEDCDTDHPVFYEQPVWQTLQMFGTFFHRPFPPHTPVSDQSCVAGGEMLCKYRVVLVHSSRLIVHLLNSRPLTCIVHFPSITPQVFFSPDTG